MQLLYSHSTASKNEISIPLKLLEPLSCSARSIKTRKAYLSFDDMVILILLSFRSHYKFALKCVRSFITSLAIISPTTDGTKALLPGTCLRCVHFLAVPGGQIQ